MDKRREELKKQILNLVEQYAQLDAAGKEFMPGKDKIHYAGRCYDAAEMLNLADSALEFWLTAGRFAGKFEAEFAEFIGVRHALLVNSGSSANLLAFMTLTQFELGERRIKRGDEVITAACGFPTTVAPILQYGAVPVFVDINPDTLNVDVSSLKQALSSRTKAVFLAHTLGNPFQLQEISAFCKENNLWLIEDNCDALGSKYHGKFTGSFGDIATSSFYPPHHITMGEGGAVYTDSDELHRLALSLRDWGRDCHCDPGRDNCCGKRFCGQFGTLPYGYDHKYVYSRFGYNLKATDMQAAVGCAQLGKLPEFIRRRRENHDALKRLLKVVENYFIPQQELPDCEPSWFGYFGRLPEHCNLDRNTLADKLEKSGIQTRNLFAGNLLRHPCSSNLAANVDYRVCGDLQGSDSIMNRGLWFGVYPGISQQQLEYMAETLIAILSNKK